MVLKWIKKIVGVCYRLFAITIFLLVWELASRTGLADPIFLPPFSKVFIEFINLLISGELFKHLAISFQRSILGFSLGLVISVPLGLIIGWFKGFERFSDPLLQTFRQTSTLALFPVFILLFGIGEVSKIAIIFWGVQWAILLNTIAGVKNVDPLLIKSARSMGTSSFKIFIKVIIPASVPSIFTGVRLSATTSVLILVAAEMMGANSGLGFLIYDAEVKYQIPKMYAAIISMSMLGLIMNYSLVAIEKRVTRWKEEPHIGI